VKDAHSNLDSADRLMISGLLYMGAGLVLVVGGPPATLVGGLVVISGVGLLAVGNASLGIGAATSFMSEGQQDEALKGMKATKEIVMKVHQPVETGAEALGREIHERFGNKKTSESDGLEQDLIDPEEDIPTTEPEDTTETLKGNLRESLSELLERVGDELMYNDVDPTIERRGEADLKETNATDAEPGMCRERDADGSSFENDAEPHEPREGPMCREPDERRLP
jgi:hypothetical protein